MGVQEDQIGVPLSRAVLRDHLVPGISQKLREEVPKIGVVRALRAGEVQGKPAAQGVKVRSREPRHVLGESTLSRGGGARGVAVRRPEAVVLVAMGHLSLNGLRVALLLWCDLDPSREDL